MKHFRFKEKLKNWKTGVDKSEKRVATQSDGASEVRAAPRQLRKVALQTGVIYGPCILGGSVYLSELISYQPSALARGSSGGSFLIGVRIIAKRAH